MVVKLGVMMFVEKIKSLNTTNMQPYEHEKELVFSDDLIEIMPEAFIFCEELERLVLPNSLRVIVTNSERRLMRMAYREVDLFSCPKSLKELVVPFSLFQRLAESGFAYMLIPRSLERLIVVGECEGEFHFTLNTPYTWMLPYPYPPYKLKSITLPEGVFIDRNDIEDVQILEGA